MLIALINANRIIDGIIKNGFNGTANLVKSFGIDLIHHYLFSGIVEEEASTTSLNTTPTGELSDNDAAKAKSDIDSLLSGGAPANPDKKAVSIVKKLRPPLLVPDFILFCPPPDHNEAKRITLELRRSLQFRDIPILIITETANLLSARELLSCGADDIQTLPIVPAQFVQKIEKMSHPVGGNLPVITKLINPYISAVLDLMTTMAGLHVVRKDLFLKKNYRIFGDISGIMNFSGKIEGSVTVSFPEELAKLIVSNIMGSSPSDISSDDLRDGVGELINIISGNAKASLAETEFSHEIALPAVIQGMGHQVRHPDGAPCIVVLFEAEGRPFAVLVSMAVNSKGVTK